MSSSETYGIPLLISGTGVQPLSRLPLQGSDYDENYVRNLAFEHPSCLPIPEIDSAYKGAVPICKELHTPAGPLDALFVNPDGRLIVVEAKLWRNPEARRKVVAQVLDYAKELSRWDYEDLQRAVSANLGRKGNALYDIVRNANPDLEESVFVDAVSRSLREGRFLLLIIGDGIREGAGAIANFIQKVGTLEFTFGLVEMNIYHDGAETTLVVPRVLARTEIIHRSIISLREGRLELETEASEDEGGELSESEQWYEGFWEEFVGELKLDDPTQTVSRPSRFGNLYFSMPPSGSEAWVSSYFIQNKGQVGVYLRLKKGNLAERLSAALEHECEAILSELGPGAKKSQDNNGNLSFHTSLQYPDPRGPEHREEIKKFFAETANRYVNTFRPRLARIAGDIEA